MDVNRDLYNAAANGDVEKVKLALAHVSDVTNINWGNEKGNTALYIACARGPGDQENTNLLSYCEIIELLVAKGADIEITNNDGKSPLYIAASWGYWDIVKILIKNGVNLTATNEVVGNRIPLEIASRIKPRLHPNVEQESYYSDYGKIRKHYAYNLAKCYIEEVMESKQHFEFLDALQADNQKMISYAAQHSQEKIPNYPDYIMIIVVFYNYFATIVELVQASKPVPPLTHSDLLKEQTKKLVEERDKFAVELTELTRNEQGERLYNAAASGNLKEVEEILNSVPNIQNIIDWTNIIGNTPLYIACAWGVQEEVETTVNTASYFKITQILIKNGANVNARNRDGKSPLYISASWGLWNIVQLLIANGAEVDDSALDIASFTEPHGTDMHYNNNKISFKHHFYNMAKYYMEKVMTSEEYLQLLPEVERDYKQLISNPAGDVTVNIPNYIMTIIIYYNHFATIVELIRASESVETLKESCKFNRCMEKLRKSDGRVQWKKFKQHRKDAFKIKRHPWPPNKKYLNVADGNDIAKKIALLLSGGLLQMRESLSENNEIYEFSRTFRGVLTTMVMTSVSGHLIKYEFDSQLRDWQSCDPDVLFDAPIVQEYLHNSQNIKATLEREIELSQGLIIWTNCDMEGENIGFEISKVCRDAKPSIPVYRARFSEITPTSVVRALENLVQLNEFVNQAADVRRELALRCDAFTRLHTTKLRELLPQEQADAVIRSDFSQFPILGFVVERYQANREFESQQFWKIQMNHKIGDLTVEFNCERKFFDESVFQDNLRSCWENCTALVKLVDITLQKKLRPLPLNTADLLKIVSRSLGISAKVTMETAEQLYRKGYISYPRTQTNSFSTETHLTSIVKQHCEDITWGPFARRILEEWGLNPRQGEKSDGIHPPIHPTKYVDKWSNLTEIEKEIYEFIVKHFLACLSNDAVLKETVVHVEIANKEFVGKGLAIVEKNYLEVYPYEQVDTKEIYNYKIGESFEPTRLYSVADTTVPPKLLTEADLISLMEENNIARNVTYAELLEKTKLSKFICSKGREYFVPTALGLGLARGYSNMDLQVSLTNPEFWGSFENQLTLICGGDREAGEVKSEQIEKYKAIYKVILENVWKIEQSVAHSFEAEPLDEQTMSWEII